MAINMFSMKKGENVFKKLYSIRVLNAQGQGSMKGGWIHL